MEQIIRKIDKGLAEVIWEGNGLINELGWRMDPLNPNHPLYCPSFGDSRCLKGIDNPVCPPGESADYHLCPVYQEEIRKSRGRR